MNASELTVNSHVAGSYCVAHLKHELYIDARKDCRHPTTSFIELVSNGQVVRKRAEPNASAAELIVDWIRQHSPHQPKSNHAR